MTASLAAALVFGALAGAATLLGGLLVLRLRPRRGWLLAAAAGALIGVALFDLLPEAITTAGAGQTSVVAAAIGIGFALYVILDGAPRSPGRQSAGGLIGPASLCLHSLFDGLGIGVAFRADPTLGWTVGAAVLAHDLVDGANTVTLSLEGGGSRARARTWLWVDAAAPLAGVALAQLASLDRMWLARFLGVFCGVFLYIGGCDLLPRARREQPTVGALGTTLGTMGFVYVISRVVSG